MLMSQVTGDCIDPEVLRNSIRSWTQWKPSEILNVLGSYGLNTTLNSTTISRDEFTTLLSSGSIIINVNMWGLPRGVGINKPYRTLHPFWGHYLVVTGIIGDQLVVLDPYDDHNPYGRLYDYDTLMSAIVDHGGALISLT
jgi:hypothetical protein